MPRRRAAPRLYLDPSRKQWVIRDGSDFERTGCAEGSYAEAEKKLADYLGRKHRPARGPNPLISDMLLFYATNHVPHIAGAKNTGYNIDNLSAWWKPEWRAHDITAARCRAYAKERTRGAARRDLEVLRASVNHWHQENGPLDSLPVIVLPARGDARYRWLERSEAARLLWAARRDQHLRRFILIGLYTGNRPGTTLGLEWRQIDLRAGTMARRLPGVAEQANKRTPRVRLGRKILAHLRRWRRLDGEAVRWVCHYDGKVVRKLRRSFPGAADRAGLEDVTPHTLRHTRATWLMQAGVDMWEAAGSLGMSAETLQRVYGHHHPNWQKNAAEV